MLSLDPSSNLGSSTREIKPSLQDRSEDDQARLEIIEAQVLAGPLGTAWFYF